MTARAERARSLITHGQSGFLFANMLGAWRQFLAALPHRARLAEMGTAAAATAQPGWDATARGYNELCVSALDAWSAERGD